MKIPEDLEKIYNFIYENILIKEVKFISILRIFSNNKIGCQMFASGEKNTDKLTKFDDKKINQKSIDIMFDRICNNLLNTNTKLILICKIDLNNPLEINMITFGDKIKKGQEEYLLELIELDEKFRKILNEIGLGPKGDRDEFR